MRTNFAHWWLLSPVSFDAVHELETGTESPRGKMARVMREQKQRQEEA